MELEKEELHTAFRHFTIANSYKTDYKLLYTYILLYYREPFPLKQHRCLPIQPVSQIIGGYCLYNSIV